MPRKSQPQRPVQIPGSAADQTNFFIAASDYDLLNQVTRLINRQGMLSLMDTSGRVQYLVDGRRGSPLAARRILDTTQRLLRDRYLDPDDLKPLQSLAVDEVLRRWKLPVRLKGFRYLRMLLLMSAGNDMILRPIGKNLYPAIAEQFNVSYSQIERSIRYCLCNRTGVPEHLTNTEAICAMSDEVAQLVDRLSRQTKLPIVADAPMGSSDVTYGGYDLSGVY